MARTGRYGVLNVVAHPHPSGTYEKIFTQAGADTRGVRFYGDHFATVSPITPVRNNVFTGKLAIWTEIDPKSSLIDKRSLKEQLLSEAGLSLPSDVGFNSRVFSFAFRVDTHTFYIELINDEGKTISASRARAALEKVLQTFSQDLVETIDVFQKTTSNAIEQIFSTPHLRKITIQLDLPNPDDLSEDKVQVLKDLEDMRAKRLKAEITKQSGEDHLTPTARYIAMSELAKDNGFVSVVGKDEDGTKLQRSTREYPRTIEAPVPQENSRASLTRVVAERD